jgi:RecB family exonuclease
METKLHAIGFLRIVQERAIREGRRDHAGIYARRIGALRYDVRRAVEHAKTARGAVR